MAHPVRKAEAEAVQAALDRPVEIVYDPVPVPSADPAQRWANGVRCWEAHDPAADWHMVIQDDALPCEDLIAGLEAALEVLGPEGLVCAYTGTPRPNQTHVRSAQRQAAAEGHSWMCTRSLCWGVAIIAPTKTIPDMLGWCSDKRRAHKTYDMRVGQYYRDVLGWRTWYPVPSLVDHRAGDSLVGHGAERQAFRMVDGSTLDVDWTRTPPGGLKVEHSGC
jgi:hypothetical protein